MRRRDDAALLVVLPRDTNTSFATQLCALLSPSTTSLQISFSSPPAASGAPFFALPPCFYTYSPNWQSAKLSYVIAKASGHNSSFFDAFSSNLTSLSLSNVYLMNDDDTLAVTQNTPVDWSRLFTSLPNLDSLQLASANLYGSLPDVMPSRISFFDITWNNINGTIPSALFSLYNASAVDFSLKFVVSYNRLSGTIPLNLWSSGGNFDRMNYFTVLLDENALTGTITPSILLPARIAASNATIQLSIAANRLNGTIPSDLTQGMPESAWLTLNLGSNPFIGTLPPALFTFGNASSMLYLSFRAANTRMNGTLPNSLLSTLVNLQTLIVSLGDNAFTGSIPTSLISIARSHSPTALTISVRNSDLSGSLPDAAFSALNLTNTVSVSFDFSWSPFTGGLPSTCAMLTPSPKLGFYSLVTTTSPFDGNVPSTFFLPLNMSITHPNPTPLSIYMDLASSSFTGTLELPNLSGRTLLQSVGLSFSCSACDLTKLVIDPAASQYLTFLYLGRNYRLTADTIPASIFSAGSPLLALYAFRTSLSFVMPNMAALPRSQLLILQLSSTDVDFCSGDRSPWNATLAGCGLMDTSAHMCPELYPHCDTSLTPIAPSNPPRSTTPAEEGCILQIPKGVTETIDGNLNCSSVVFGDLSSFLVIKRCANYLTRATVEMSSSELKRFGPQFSRRLISYSANDSSCSSLIGVEVIPKAKDSCRSVKVIKVEDIDGSLVATFSVHTAPICRLWWVILIVALFVVLLIVMAIIIYCLKKHKKHHRVHSL